MEVADLPLVLPVNLRFSLLLEDLPALRISDMSLTSSSGIFFPLLNQEKRDMNDINEYK
tara:strand:+ start:1895 stop:2071 length:177 start_codon:yes stop_codon:yes gene_type:complete